MTETTLFCEHQAWQQMHLNDKNFNAHSYAAVTFSVHLHLDVYLNICIRFLKCPTNFKCF